MRAAMTRLLVMFHVVCAALIAADVVPDFRSGTVELSLGVSTLFFPDRNMQKAGAIAGAALSLSRWNLVAFADWTQLPAGGQGTISVQGQLLSSGVQYQITRAQFPWRATPFAEAGMSLANTQLTAKPPGYIYDNDAGNRAAWIAGAGLRIPFGREARAGLKLGYRHIGIPSASERRHLHQFTMELLMFIRPN